MALSPRIVRIAMLNTDDPAPVVLAKLGSYGTIFHRKLSYAAAQVAPHIEIQSEEFNVVQGEYPSRATDFDLLLVTGSAASAYYDLDWIHKLSFYLRQVYEMHPEVKIFGSCFGHQLLGQVLLKEYGVFVEKDPNGYELGVRTIHLTDEFVAAIGGDAMGAGATLDRPPTPKSGNEAATTSTASKSLRFQIVHADHVKIPSETGLPAPWMSIGGTSHTAVHGLYNPGRVLTYQGHFEFDRFINSETIKFFGLLWDPEVLKKALDACESDDDSELGAEILVKFMLEEPLKLEQSSGLLTPPV